MGDTLRTVQARADLGCASIAGGAGQRQSDEERIAREIIEYSWNVLNTSSFFRKLRNGDISLPELKYVFCQNGHWRDQFHTWFGLCIAKSGSCAPKYVQDVVLELAEHTVTEMREDHAGLYREFLARLGVTPEEQQRTARSRSTLAYEQSFLRRFGTGTANFVDSVAALSARELFAALRNAFVTKALKEKYGIGPSPWWRLHEQVEIGHFRCSIRPIIEEPLGKRSLSEALSIMKTEIECHARYWDALANESRTAVDSSAR